MKRLIIGFTLLLSLTACSKNTPAPAPSGGTNTPGPAAGTTGNQGTATVDAQALYKQNCMACHGADLSGGVGPNIQKVGSKLSTDQIVTQISNGKGAMPPFKGTLKDPDINALAQWLESHK